MDLLSLFARRPPVGPQCIIPFFPLYDGWGPEDLFI
jgi:hypothetical protein